MNHSILFRGDIIVCKRGYFVLGLRPIPSDLLTTSLLCRRCTHRRHRYFANIHRLRNLAITPNSKVGVAEANDTMTISPSSTSPWFAFVACVRRFARLFCNRLRQFARWCLCSLSFNDYACRFSLTSFFTPLIALAVWSRVAYESCKDSIVSCLSRHRCCFSLLLECVLFETSKNENV